MCINLVLFSCASKQEVKKSPLYWYKNLVKAVENGNLEKADDYYASLKAEQINSVFLPQANMILAIEHINNKEYLLANFYFDEYLTKFGEKDNSSLIEYFKILSAYKSFENPKRNQQLLLDTIANVNSYIQNNEDKEFYYHAKTIGAILMITNSNMNKDIANLYRKRNKPKAQKFYKQEAFIEGKDDFLVKQPHTSWFRWLFE